MVGCGIFVVIVVVIKFSVLNGLCVNDVIIGFDDFKIELMEDFVVVFEIMWLG